MKKVFFVILFSLTNVIANADMVKDYLSVVPNPQLSESEIRSLRVIEEWQKGKRPSPVSIGNNGEIEIIYGLTQPQILCAVLQITDIQFEPGEKIFSVHLGDSSRWTIEPAFTGHSNGDIAHLIIKPKDVNLLTSLVVTTNFRTYHLRLKSHKTEYYPMVKFVYPEQIKQKMEQKIAEQSANHDNRRLPTGEYLDNLDFRYRIKGKAKFRPTRIYNDGLKTIIELPGSIKSDNAPVIYLIQKDSKHPVLVNYRLQSNRLIVDSVFDKAILISGIGFHQEKITIIKGD